MVWIIWATILNTVWTVWCLKLLPARIATKFGTNGQPVGSMSRRGFGIFAILFPVAMSAFLVYIGGLGSSTAGMPTAMEHLAAAFTIYFSFLSWCIVRSNRNSPARVDVPSLLVGVVFLVAVMFLSFRGIAKTPVHQSAISTQR